MRATRHGKARGNGGLFTLTCGSATIAAVLRDVLATGRFKKRALRLRKTVESKLGKQLNQVLQRRGLPPSLQRGLVALHHSGYKIPEAVYLGLVRIYQREGKYDTAQMMIDLGRARHPESVKLAKAHAQLATSQRDWPSAIERWEKVLSIGQAAPLGAFLRLSQAHRYLHELDAALAVMARAEVRFPGDMRVDVERAEVALTAKDWPTVFELWSAILETYGDEVPATGYVRLSQASRYQANYTAALSFVELGMGHYPAEKRLAIEHAEVGMAGHDWEAAIGRWQDVIDRYKGDVPTSVYVRQSIAHRHNRDFPAAYRTLAQCPPGGDDSLLELERAELAMAEGDLSKATACFEDILASSGDKTPAIVFVRLLHLHCRAKDFDGAEALFERARLSHPRDASLLIQYVEIAVSRQDWAEVIERSHLVIDTSAWVPPKAYLRLANAHRVLEDPHIAGEIAAGGLDVYPSDIDLAREHAEAAMAQRQWSAAIQRWDHFVTLSRRRAISQSARVVLPNRSRYVDWYECDWETMAKHWMDAQEQASEVLYAAVVDTLLKNGWGVRADALAARATSEYPADASLAIQYAELAMVRRDWLIAADRWRAVLSSQESPVALRVFEGLCIAHHMRGDAQAVAEASQEGSRSYPHLRTFGDELRANQQIFESLAPSADQGDEIPLHLIRYQPGSSVSKQLRSGVYLTRQTITERLEIISEQLGAIRTSRGMRSLKRAGWLMAKRYADKYQRPPLLPAGALADAAHYHFVTELATLLPIRHIARRLASEHSDRPIFIELRRRNLRCLRYWTDNHMEPLFLYCELRKRGANAILCLADYQAGESAADEVALHFALDLSWERTAALPLTSGRVASSAIIPAGIRGLDRVLESCEGSHLFPSAHVVNPRPYSPRYQMPTLSFTETIYPSDLHRNELSVTFEPGPALACRDSDGEVLHARANVARGVDLHLLSQFDRLLGDVLQEMAQAAADRVRDHQIDTLHVCDHHFLESALMEHAVIRAGGKITVWPHSTNPVDYKTRRAQDLERVVCITKAGQQIWQAQLPDVPVELRSELMLPAPVAPAPYDPDKPLTVVVIGGGSLMARLPAVSLAKHRESYRGFLLGLKGLGSAVDIVFKPKGVWLETVPWLHRVVDGQVSFRVASTHPLHIDLPNMVFVTVSYGSSALLEGISRGIPALIVRDFPVDDYTTIDTQIVPAKTTDEIIEELRALANPGRWQQMVKAQMAYYRSETGSTETGS